MNVAGAIADGATASASLLWGRLHLIGVGLRSPLGSFVRRCSRLAVAAGSSSRTSRSPAGPAAASAPPLHAHLPRQARPAPPSSGPPRGAPQFCPPTSPLPPLGASGLWPCPLPHPSVLQQTAPRNRRTRRRFRRKQLLNLLVLALSWLSLGGPSAPPAGFQAGAPLSPEQEQMVLRLDAVLEPWAGCPGVQLGHLGRAADKVKLAHSAIRRLESVAERLQAEFDPYGASSRQRGGSDAPHGTDPLTEEVDRMRGADMTSCRPLRAERVPLLKEPTFDAAPFLPFGPRGGLR